MKRANIFKNQLFQIAQELPENSLKEVVDFASYLSWQNIPQRSFMQRVDSLWDKMHNHLKEKKISLRMVDQLIMQVRKNG